MSGQLVSLDPRAVAEVQKLKLQLVKSDNQKVDTVQKQKKQVLDEEEYADRIDSIIERDFFPDVTKLRLELEYQDALEKNDYDRLQILGKQRLESNHRTIACDTPATFETPLNRAPDFACPVKLDPRLVTCLFSLIFNNACFLETTNQLSQMKNQWRMTT